MATLSSGFLGPIRGTISNTVAMKRGDKNIVRVRGVRTKPSTEAQIVQQRRFNETVRLMRRFMSVVRFGYQTSNTGLSAFNQAVKANMPAMMDNGTDLMWDYSQLSFSDGIQTGFTSSVVAESTQAEVIDLTWENNATDDVLSLANDTVSVVLLCEETEQVIFKKNAAVREDLLTSITLPQALSGKTIHIWCMAYGAISKEISPTEYVGSVVLA